MSEARPGAGTIRAKRPSKRLHRQLVIRSTDSPEQWRHFLHTLEELAESGEFIECDEPPLELHHASTPLRRDSPRKPAVPAVAGEAPPARRRG